jgi:lysophospholipase L1-like esterase
MRNSTGVKPDLVLWQVGTNDALSASVSEPKFEAVVERGLLSIERHKSDVLLVDPQFTKKTQDPATSVLSRCWSGLRRRSISASFPAIGSAAGVEPLLAPDGFHMNDAVYACIAERLAGQIDDLVNQPAP